MFFGGSCFIPHLLPILPTYGYKLKLLIINIDEIEETWNWNLIFVFQDNFCRPSRGMRKSERKERVKIYGHLNLGSKEEQKWAKKFEQKWVKILNQTKSKMIENIFL